MATGGPAGVLVADKPAGITSHDLVARERRERGVRAGHAGTLDPFATGVLLVLLGRATRLQRYLLGLDKTYEATAKLGWKSSTGDPDGELEQTGRIPPELTLPTGEIRQMVPMTSAVRVKGERLYRRAHRGEHDAERPVRKVTVHSAELLGAAGDEARFRLRVSSGTYIRTLIETLGDAYCAELRRVAVGPIGIDRAGAVLTPAEALSFLPRLSLTGDQAQAVAHGRALGAAGCEPAAAEGEALALVHGDSLVAVARRSGDTVRPEVVMEPAG